MNSLEATLTKVETPVWDEQYQTYRVKVEYTCWGHPGKTEIWKKDRSDAFQVKVGDTINV